VPATPPPTTTQRHHSNHSVFFFIFWAGSALIFVTHSRHGKLNSCAGLTRVKFLPNHLSFFFFNILLLQFFKCITNNATTTTLEQPSAHLFAIKQNNKNCSKFFSISVVDELSSLLIYYGKKDTYFGIDFQCPI